MEDESMFAKIEHQLFWYTIVYHKDTKVIYAISKDGIFTPLISPDGSPMLYKESEEDHGENKSEKDNS